MTKPILPSTRRDDVIDRIHGVDIPDPYRWLEDQDSPETRAWLDAQIDYTHRTLEKYPGRDKVRDRLAELMKIESSSQPIERGGDYYFARRLPDQQQYVIYRRRAADRTDEVFVDPHPMSEDHTTSVNLLDVSHDGRLAAYTVRVGGADETAIRIRATDTLRDLDDALPPARFYGFAFSSDSLLFYYSLGGPEGPRVLMHKIGDSVENDVEIFGAGLGPDKIVGIVISDDGKFLVFTVYHGSAGTKTEIHIAEVDSLTTVRPIVDNIMARFSAQAAGGELYMLTNWNAPNGRVIKLSATAAANSTNDWREIVPERPDAVLSEFALTGGHLLLNYLENVSSRVLITNDEGELIDEIKLPGIGAVSGPIGRWNSPEVFFSFSSFAMPPVIFRCDGSTGCCELWAKSEAPLNSEEIEVRQIWYQSKDGTGIPMFLVHRKNLVMDGKRPIYMTAYGGFTVSRTPAFTPIAVLWAELGGIFALPSLRGGGEFGERWHLAGMLEKKQNVFDDFYAAAEWLISSGYSTPSKLGIAGRSNGGLLVGTAITQRPELFGAAICGYPLLDMIRYQKFLVAGFWVPEYGSAEDPKQFEYLYAYSPYHHVQPLFQYPAIMFVTGDSDTRVAPLHARKMAALMQANSSVNSPVLLHYDVKSGHSDGKPIDQTVEDTADEVLFLLNNLGV